MDLHGVLSAAACAGHLAFAIVVWLRRGKSPVAPLLALLFVDAFGWNFAALAHSLSGAREWHAVDRFFSSFMPMLALHVVLAFVGRATAWKRFLRVGYGLSLVFALGGLDVELDAWWIGLLAIGNLAVALAVWLLVAHRRLTDDATERARTDLILVALVVGALTSSTELWFDEVNLTLEIPPFGNVGTLFAMVLFAVATLRLRLIESHVPAVLFAYALAFAGFWVTAHLLAVRWLERHTALSLLAVLTFGVLVLAVARELGRSAAVGRERVRRLATLGRFTEQLAHDIRNPLAALKGTVQFLSTERAEGRSLDAHGEFLRLMLEQVNRLERIVADYQRMAKVEAVLTEASLDEVVREVVGAQRFAVVPGVKLRTELAGDLPNARLDRDLVATTLENVLRNAYEAMPNGGSVTVRTERVPGRPREVSLTVEDEGHGMDARVLERATSEFFTTKATGTGLGLSFADRVAEAHGGSLSLTSREGKGTVVRLSFPSAE